MTQSHQQRSGPQSDAGMRATGSQTDVGDRASRWEERYASVERLWSGRPNDWLPELATDWEPGTALEIGCGEGADVLWLAEHGWQVTGLDLSATAVGRLNREAERRGVASRATGVVHDVGDGLPEGPFDLVTSFYVHGGPEEGSLDLVALLSNAAAHVAPGGRLLTAVHAVNPPWHTHHARTYTADELVVGLAGETAGWEVVVAEERRRQVTGPDGQEGWWADAVVCLRRPQPPSS